MRLNRTNQIQDVRFHEQQLKRVFIDTVIILFSGIFFALVIMCWMSDAVSALLEILIGIPGPDFCIYFFLPDFCTLAQWDQNIFAKIGFPEQKRWAEPSGLQATAATSTSEPNASCWQALCNHSSCAERDLYTSGLYKSLLLSSVMLSKGSFFFFFG